MIVKTEPLFLYSTNAYLASFLARKFYKGEHFVWCGAVFDPRSLDDLDPLKNIPTTSSPHDIYAALKKECDSADLHGPNIERIKTGLLRGAVIKRGDGVITDKEYSHIVAIINTAQIKYFSPQLYIISRKAVELKLQPVEYDKMASPLSEEYIIPNLTLAECDIIKLSNL